MTSTVEISGRTAPCPEVPPRGLICVRHQGGDRFRIAIRQHDIRVDQPVEDGGEDTAPTPTELFAASLASCVAFYAHRFLDRHDIPADGLTVTADFAMADKPARVGEVGITINVPEAVPRERRPALLAVASHCTVHNTLEQPPKVTVALASAAGG
jgi:putative redox protein